MTQESDALPDDVRRVAQDGERLTVLNGLHVLDTPPDQDFDRIARMAASAFGVPYAQVTLIDRSRQWYRACHGVEGLSETSLDVSFCAHTIADRDNDEMVVPNTTTDSRFADNPFVTGWPGIRFYAGVPIEVHGQRIGTVCVMSPTAMESVDDALMQQLHDFSKLAAGLFVLKDEARVRARTAAALLREEWRHALTLEAGKVGSWVWNIPDDEVTCNDMFRRICGLVPAGDVTFDAVLQKLDPAHIEGVKESLGASLESGEDWDIEARIAGSDRWVVMRGRVYQRDADGKAMVMMGICIDDTENKLTAARTKALLRELNHRVKNTLAMIESMARQTTRQNPDPESAAEAFSGRLRTLSAAHLLLADRDWSGVQLYEVVEAQLGNGAKFGIGRATARGDDVVLPPDHALGLGLVLHELTTNAKRHGALSSDAGRVELSWNVETSPQSGLRLVWQEHDGPVVTEQRQTGLGSRLIERGLDKVLNSEVRVEFAQDGVKAEIWMPLPKEAPRSHSVVAT